MPPPPRLVAWASIADLISVKEQFYSDQSSCDQRRLAVDQVKAWLTRDRLPHAIESTMQLTEVVLRDESFGDTSNLMLRLSYSTAICRFVNGLLDPAQKSHFAAPMHALALDLGLPSSFVEIRHAATHEALPSLLVLRRACNRALIWLRDNFWQAIGDSLSSESSNDTIGAARGGFNRGQELRARVTVRQWIKLRRQTQAGRDLSKTGELTKEATAIIRDCASLCSEEDGIPLVIDAILGSDEKAKSSERNSETSDSATSLWRPLIENVDAQVRGFVEQLVSCLLDHLEGPATEGYRILNFDANLREAEYKDAVYTWLEDVIGCSSTKPLLHDQNSQSNDGRSEIIENCISSSSKWSIRLAKNLANSSSSLARRYSNAIAAAEQFSVTQPVTTRVAVQTTHSGKRPIGEVTDELDEFEARIEAMKAQRELWEKARSETKYKDTMVGGDDMDTNEATTNSSRENIPKPSGSDVARDTTITAGKFRKANPWKNRPIGAMF